MAVRREAVRLELEDHFSSGMVKAAAATELLDRKLKGLEGTGLPRLGKASGTASREVDGLARTSRRSGAEIDQLSGRVRILADVFATLGPAIAPVGGVAAAAVAGLASQVGFATIGMGSLLIASQGVGDALKAVEKARLEPTAANIDAAQAAMSKLAPEAQAFVTRLQQVMPVLRQIRNASAAGWFPGLTVALDELEMAAPRFQSLLRVIGQAGGSLAAEGAGWFNTEGGQEFLTFVERNAPAALEDLGHSIGNVTSGLAKLWMATDPLNDDFSAWLVTQSQAFEQWADGLGNTEGYREFVEYVRTNGPKVAETAGAIALAMVEVVEAIAPLGGPALETIEGFAKAVSAIADSDLGTPIFTAVAAYAALNRVLQVTAALQRRIAQTDSIGGGLAAGGVLGGLRGAGGGLRTAGRDLKLVGDNWRYLGASAAFGEARQSKALTGIAKGTAAIGGLTLATSGAADSMGFSNTASLALMGTLAGPWGAAVGGGIGLMIDLAQAAEQYAGAQERANEALRSNDVEKINAAIAEQQKILSNARDSDKITGVGDFFSDLQRGLSGHGTQEERDSAEVQIDRLKEALGSAHVAAVEFADTQARIAADRQISEWARSVGADMFQLSQDIQAPELSLFKLEQRMREQGRAAADMGRNIGRAIRNGADPEAIKQLVDELGADAGLALEQLARGGESAANRFNASFRRSKAGTDLLASNIDRLAHMVGRFPNLTIKAGLDGAAAVEAAIGRLTRPRLVKITATTNANVADAYVNRWSGGYTGAGGKYDPAGIVHRGEVVIPQELVQRDRGLLRNRYGHLPGMESLASGGLAGRTSTSAIIRDGALRDAREAREAARATKELAREARASAKQLRELRGEYDRTKSRRDAILSARSDLTGAVSSGLTSDLWGSGEWSSSDPMSILRADIARARQFNVDRARLYSKGLRGSALEDILRAGAEDPTKIRELAGMSAAQIRQYRGLFNQRAQLVGTYSRAAGNDVFAAPLTAIEKKMDRLEKAIDRNTHSRKVEQSKNRRADRGTSARVARSGDRGTVRR